MKIRELLTENVHCPNCGERAIIRIYDGMEQREYYKCEYCGQAYSDNIVDELYTFKPEEQEKEDDDDDCCFAVPGPGFFFMKKKQEEKEKEEMEFFDLREDIHGLRYHIKTIHDEHLITHLQVILNKMTDILERKG